MQTAGFVTREKDADAPDKMVSSKKAVNNTKQTRSFKLWGEE